MGSSVGMASTRRISSVEITPVAFSDPPLLNTVGVHEASAIRGIIQIRTNDGLVGVGETYGDEQHLRRLQGVADRLLGVDVMRTLEIYDCVTRAVRADRSLGGHGMSGMVTGSSTVDRVFSPFEVAILDIQGKAFDVPVSALLGGALRESVEYSGYLFYKWEGHPGYERDEWGQALHPEELVEQARRMIREYGFSSLKLKGGVFPPEEEAAAIEAIHREFPEVLLRIDPNGAWSVNTAVRVGRRLDGIVEYLEDPTLGRQGMAEVRNQLSVPLATNMCVVSFKDVPEAVRLGSVDIVLSDHHFWGGIRRSQLLAGVCETFGLDVSMHSNSHLGISLAAMTHLAAATPNSRYACDTHWPWKDEAQDIISETLKIKDGRVVVPQGPGLGVTLDEEKLQERHEAYLSSGLVERDDTGYMRKFHPDFDPTTPRW